MSEGVVTRSTGSWYYVRQNGDEPVPCRIKGKFRLKEIRATNPVAVGDLVTFSLEEGQNSGLITAIHPRKNYIIRKASNLSREYQLIACNIDIAWLMVSMVAPKTLTAFIDRFLVSAEAFRIPVIILFNKTDIYDETERKEMDQLIRVYTGAGYPCYPVSVLKREGIDRIRDEMKGKVSVISGNSGVGKSALIQAVDPALILKTGEISEYHLAGKHTTTYAEMFELASGGAVIDTPGIRGFGTIDIAREELFHFFPEIFRESGNCQYHNCLHLMEPKCAVKKAVDEGTISESRYLSYLAMLEDSSEKYR
ncbi:MAG: ribosome small subunit-dependent GTPase A [Bacteroidota bacterium]